MILTIDTTENSELRISLNQGAKQLVLVKQPTNRNQAEKLLPLIEKILIKQGLKLNSLKKIIVHNGQGSFTSLRIGIATANALAYALNIPVQDNYNQNKTSKKIKLVVPKYAHAPDITKSKK